ncbi:hypothetical protein [Halorubellus sp. PRR65]|uniref:hypothetical protein n=1 Tax=Halorubellus sp. PRR65 TaxID=3098148 RepID=UPI002B258B0C|nr:hypothetical protein [Halorubellus sp. PRR65]
MGRGSRSSGWRVQRRASVSGSTVAFVAVVGHAVGFFTARAAAGLLVVGVASALFALLGAAFLSRL